MSEASGRRRRHHSAAKKAEILEACAQPGASVASVALAYGVNANLVHRWRRQAAADGRCLSTPAAGALAEFVPVALTAAPAMAASPDIRIELRRGACSITVAWPTSAAADCASWLRDLVR